MDVVSVMMVLVAFKRQEILARLFCRLFSNGRNRTLDQEIEYVDQYVGKILDIVKIRFQRLRMFGLMI